MATDQDVTSDSLDSSVVDVPKELLEYVKSSIMEYISKATPEQFFAKIHYAEGQSPKLEVSFGGKQQKQAFSLSTETNVIIVQNVPESADEELLEVFFESTKKQGGGPVKRVKILGDKQVALVEFCNSDAVEKVLKKRPIKLGKLELDVQPFKPLLHGAEKIKHVRIDLPEWSDTFSDDLLINQFESLNIHREPVPDYGPELCAMLKIGSRVVKGRDWVDDDRDGGPGGQGTVTQVYKKGAVDVQWDNGTTRYYEMGVYGKYRLKLAP